MSWKTDSFGWKSETNKPKKLNFEIKVKLLAWKYWNRIQKTCWDTLNQARLFAGVNKKFLLRENLV